MAKRHLLMLGLLLGGGALSSAACSDTKATGIPDEAGAAGEAGDNGHAGHAGSGNAGTGNGGSGNATGDAGATNAAGEAGTGGEGGSGEPPFEFPPSLNPQAVIVVAPTPTTAATHLLVGGTDYMSKSEIVSLTLGSGAVGDAETYSDGDTVATSSAGLAFAIERTNDKVHLLDGGKISSTFDLKETGNGQAPAEGSKAYVPLLNQSLIVILDLNKGTVSSRIDLSEYNAPGDSDHSADIAEGVYDPNSKLAYFLLQRVDVKSGFPLPCSKNPGLIVGIDTKTDEVVDLNGDAEGKAVELKLVNPRSLSVNADGSALYFLADGCSEDGKKKIHRGVEVVDTSDGTTTVAYESDGSDALANFYLSQMILTGGEDALISSFHDDDFATHWNKFDIAAGKVGAEVANVPDAPSFDGTDLLGVEVTGKVGKVVRYKLSTESSTVISPTSWGGEYSSTSSTALVK
jgi:hypothetical protein